MAETQTIGRFRPVRTIVLDGRDVYVRATTGGRVEFRHKDDNVWFSLDGFEHSAKDVLQRLSPTALRTIADVKEATP